MKKLLLLSLFSLLLIPSLSSAQTTDCVSYYNGLSAKTTPWAPVYVTPPAGCTGPIKTPIQQNPNGTCNWGYYPGQSSQASGTASKWIAAENRSQIWFYEKDEFNTPESYAVNWGTCDLKLEWSGPGYACNRVNPLMPKCEYKTSGYGNTSQTQCTDSCKPDSPYSAVITHHKVGQTEQKRAYEIGDKIEFVGYTNAEGTNNRYSWNFGDNMWTSGTSLSYAPVIYKTPGIKKVTFNVTNATGQSYVATSTEVKIKCMPPDAPSFNNLVSMLDNRIIPAPIAANNFGEWSVEKEESISNEMISNQCSYDYRENNFVIAETSRAIKRIKRVTDSKQPHLMIFELSHKLANGGVARAAHSVIALEVKDTSDSLGQSYRIRFLDPNGPMVMTADCKVRTKPFPYYLDNGQFVLQDLQAMFCEHSLLGFVIPRLDSKDIDLTESLRTAKNNFCQSNSVHPLCIKRQNLSYWLEFNYPFNISNTQPEFTPGVCRGWSEFVLEVAYLGNFVGECKTITNTATVGLADLSNILLKIQEFLKINAPLLGR